MKYLLDTSVYSQPLKKVPVQSVIERWKEIGDATCCISVFCEMEELQANFVQQGRTHPVIDLCIAATALRHGCVIATLNSRDFADIPGLKVEDWGESPD